jgi:hypothetical protein
MMKQIVIGLLGLKDTESRSKEVGMPLLLPRYHRSMLAQKFELWRVAGSVPSTIRVAASFRDHHSRKHAACESRCLLPNRAVL